MRPALRRVARFLTSARFVSVTLAFIGIWSILGTLVPQGDPAAGRALEWAEANPALADVAEALGLFDAFSAPVFLVAVGLLALSTVLCSWQRSTLASKRARALRDVRQTGALSGEASWDLLIECADTLTPSDALATAGETLQGLGIKARRHSEDALASASSPLSVWGSPVFHWALVGLMVFVVIGGLFRFEGLMGLAVGESKPHAPGSYGGLSAGPFYRWPKESRIFRLDDFEPRFKAGGIDYGPVPTVSVLDGDGNVLKTQQVYPNHKLHLGSMSISAPAYGFSVTLVLHDAAGAEIGRAVQLVDFAQEAPDGTTPVGVLPLLDEKGNQVAMLHVTVPLIRQDGRFVEWLPKDASARVVVNSADGQPLVDQVVAEGEQVELPGGTQLQVEKIGWYSRLSVMDDWSIPIIYGWMVLAVLGLSVRAFVRQQYIVVRVLEDNGGTRVGVRMRLWHNATASRDEIASALTEALAGTGRSVS